MMVSLIIHGAIESKKLPDISIGYQSKSYATSSWAVVGEQFALKSSFNSMILNPESKKKVDTYYPRKRLDPSNLDI